MSRTLTLATFTNTAAPPDQAVTYLSKKSGRTRLYGAKTVPSLAALWG
jgi:hypothetical protein